MSDKEAAHKTASANRCGNWEADNLADAYLELEAELAAERTARAQEPAAQITGLLSGTITARMLRADLNVGDKLYSTPVAKPAAERTAREQQEPVAQIVFDEEWVGTKVARKSHPQIFSLGIDLMQFEQGTKLYAAPQDAREAREKALEEASNEVPVLTAQFPETLSEDFGDPETLLNSRKWLQSALEAKKAKIVGGGCGMGQADLDIVLEGCRFNVSIRPLTQPK